MSDRILAGLEPAGVFRFFEDLTRIPRGSGHTRAVSDYCMAFARERGLAARQDSHDNVIIRKAGTAGLQDHPAVILQGHLDMVLAKEPGCTLESTRSLISEADSSFQSRLSTSHWMACIPMDRTVAITLSSYSP